MPTKQPSIVAHYRYSVAWSPEDNEHVATVAEFPSLSWMDEDQIGALKGLEVLIREVLEDMHANGEAFPQPFSERNYSGNIKVRVSPDTHRHLALAASEQGVSLNRYMTERLATC